MGWSGTELADRIAKCLDGEARALPTYDEEVSMAVALADGRAPILVRDWGRTVGVAVLGTKAWQRPPADFDEAAVREVVADAKVWAKSHAPDATTILDVALAIADAMTHGMGERVFVSVPGTPDPREMWIRLGDGDRASVGVFRDRVVVWLGFEQRSFFAPTRARLDAAREPILLAVRAQVAAYERNVAASERIQTAAASLTAKLSARLKKKCTFSTSLRPSHAGAIRATIECHDGAPREIVDIGAEEGVVRAHAGVVGTDGWDGVLSDEHASFDDLAAAAERSLSMLTIDRLVPGRRYRVRENLQQLEAGAVVRFVGFVDIDNHLGRYEFATADGKTVSVDGDFSRPRHSALGETHRYLVEVAD